MHTSSPARSRNRCYLPSRVAMTSMPELVAILRFVGAAVSGGIANYGAKSISDWD